MIPSPKRKQIEKKENNNMQQQIQAVYNPKLFTVFFLQLAALVFAVDTAGQPSVVQHFRKIEQ